jgi:hypothetical protein
MSQQIGVDVQWMRDPWIEPNKIIEGPDGIWHIGRDVNLQELQEKLDAASNSPAAQ